MGSIPTSVPQPNTTGRVREDQAQRAYITNVATDIIYHHHHDRQYEDHAEKICLVSYTLSLSGQASILRLHRSQRPGQFIGLSRLRQAIFILGLLVNIQEAAVRSSIEP